MAKSRKNKKRGRSGEQFHRSKPKHTAKDLAKALGIAGLIMGLIGALFFFQVESKPLIEHLVDKMNNESSAEQVDEDGTQMDRYTKQEADNLDRLIEEKSKEK